MNDDDLLRTYRYALAGLIDILKGPHEIVAFTGLPDDEAALIWNISQHALRNSKSGDKDIALLSPAGV